MTGGGGWTTDLDPHEFNDPRKIDTGLHIENYDTVHYANI